MENENKSAAQKAKELSEEFKEQTKQLLQDFDAQKHMDEMKESVAEFADITAKFVRKYPIQSVIGAMAAGFVLSSLMRRK